MTRLRIVVVLCASLVGASVARAQEVLTLPDALQRAASSHPSVAAAHAAADAARWRERAASSAFWPRLSAEEGWHRTNQPVLAFSDLLSQRRFTAADFAVERLNSPDPISNYRAAATVEQLLFDGGRTAADVRSARAMSTAAEADLRAAEAALRVDVTRAYMMAATAQAQLSASRSSLEAAEADLRRVADRAAAGLETEATRLTFQVRVDQVRAQVASAESALENAFVNLDAAVGLPLSTRPILQPPPPAPVSAGEEDIDRAVALRPDVQRARAAERAAEASAIAARRASLVPSVAGFAGIEGNGGAWSDRASAWTAGVTARWSVGLGGGERARTQAATADFARARAMRQLAELTAAAEIRSLGASARAAEARETGTRDVVSAAREAQRIIRNRYEAGLAPAADLLRADEQLADAERTRAGAVADLAIAAAELDRALARGGSQ